MAMGGRDAVSPLRVGACLSLSGRYARFGSQAARALQAWAVLDGDAGLVIEDDRSDPGMLQALLPKVAAGCDVLLGRIPPSWPGSRGRWPRAPGGWYGTTGGQGMTCRPPAPATRCRC